VTDADGFFVYLRDLEDGSFWSLGRVPVPIAGGIESAAWEPGIFTLSRQVAGIEARLEICVIPEAQGEIRRLTIEDCSGRHRRIEVTTCAEVVLADPAAHAAHPAFAKLFVQTEQVPEHKAVMARRRARASDEEHPWMVHAWLGAQDVTCETDRSRFVGRGRDLSAPRALLAPDSLSGTTGNVLDPVFALRAVLELAPHGTCTTAWLLAVAPRRETALSTVARFEAAGAVEMAFEAACRVAESDLQRLGVSGTEAEWAHAVAGAILYEHPGLRAAPAVLARAQGWTPALLRRGLAPQRPFAVLRAHDAGSAPHLSQVLRAHALWQTLGLPIDLVVLRGDAAVPGLPSPAPAAPASSSAGQPAGGRLIVLPVADLSPADLDALDTAARWVVKDSLPDLTARLAPEVASRNDSGTIDSTQPAARADRGAGRAAPTAASGSQDAESGGEFAPGGQEYVIPVRLEQGVLRLPPRPWINVVANERFGFLVSETGAGCTWSGNSREHRLTPWSNDPVLDPHAEAFYARDDDTGASWSLFPGPAPAEAPYEVRHGWGHTVCRHTSHGLEQEIELFVPRSDPLRIARVRLRNTSALPRRVSLFAYAQLVLGSLPEESGRFVVTEAGEGAGVLYAHNAFAGDFADGVAFAAVTGDGTPATVRWTANRAAFLGEAGSLACPAALQRDAVLDGSAGAGLAACFAHQVSLTLAAGASVDIAFLLGEGSGGDEARALAARYASFAAIEAAQREVLAFWQRTLTGVQVGTPSPAIDLMVNGWLAYQTLACRIWGRSAFYQSGGAYGFRDQLQDAVALVTLSPELAREQILLHAAHQFVEGDVLHWWHPPLGRGLRTRFADDLLWLPYLTAAYVRATGDAAVLDERVRFLTARALAPGEDEAFVLPAEAAAAADLYEHCCRTLDRSLARGPHGLPLFGSGDWNDGMNRVGHAGRGESVWMGFFLYAVLGDFTPLCEERGEGDRVRRYTAHRAALRTALEAAGWDGGWYRRGYYDDGAPLGSQANDECRIDALAQAWAVLSGAAPAERAAQAMDAVEQFLVSERDGIIRLLTPPFENTAHDPGYIKGYVPGVRENGGQYTHAALWVVQALAALGRNDRVARLLEMLSPVSHTRTPEQLAVYQVEPYVIAADVYGAPPHVGRGGWTWYTGSSGWMYRVALESLLGLTLVGGRELHLAPCVPDDWPEFTLTYRVPGEETRYEIVARNPDRRGRGVQRVTLDGVPLRAENGVARLPVLHDGRLHRVAIVLGGDRSTAPAGNAAAPL
jgi:cyclic beta-1,2-glucan synthetase